MFAFPTIFLKSHNIEEIGLGDDQKVVSTHSTYNLHLCNSIEKTAF